MLSLREAIANGSVLLDIEADDVESILQQTLDFVVERGGLKAEDQQAVFDALLKREQQISTAIGHAVAVPHAYLDCFDEQVIVFVKLSRGVNLGAPDGIPTRYLIVLLGPTGVAEAHLDTLTSIARLMSDEQFRFDAAVAQDQSDLLASLDRAIGRITPRAAVAHEVPPALEFTGRPFGGLIADFKRRWACYSPDFLDGIHTKSISSTLFLFFACLAPAVTFGGVMAVKTGGQIGAVEMILATTICGVVYALFAGQPLIILGGTGPLLIFTAILYDMCANPSFEIGTGAFLSVYAWVGLWTALFVILLAVTDSSFLMRFFTRFTDEIFAALISVIFIYEAIKALASNAMKVYREETVSHDAALVPLILAGGTFFLAMMLSRLRRSRYLNRPVREFFADFGPAIALAVMTLAWLWLNAQQTIALNKLPAPDEFGPTDTHRAWTVDLFAAPVWTRWAAAGPALLAAVLVFLDQNITARLVNSPDHKLNKGEAYHWDLLIVGLLIGGCSLFGLPWLVAATVRSLNHLRSLATVEAVVGQQQQSERVLHVRENRITPLAIHILIGAALLALPLLKTIPMAVLYGIFLFMGVVSLSGNQFFERMSLWAMDRSLYPSTHYIRRVPLKKIHKFTGLQFVCLAVLWIVKTSVLGILFPLFIGLLVPIRLFAAKFFTDEELAALDAEEQPAEESEDYV